MTYYNSVSKFVYSKTSLYLEASTGLILIGSHNHVELAKKSS